MLLCKDLDLNSLQGDKEVIDILERMNVVFNANDIGVKGTTNGELTSTVIDGSQCPDIIPVLTASSSFNKRYNRNNKCRKT